MVDLAGLRPTYVLNIIEILEMKPAKNSYKVIYLQRPTTDYQVPVVL